MTPGLHYMDGRLWVVETCGRTEHQRPDKSWTYRHWTASRPATRADVVAFEAAGGVLLNHAAEAARFVPSAQERANG